MEGRGTGEDEPALSSPCNKVKFMCSHGGRILPRPSDGQLKYVGGETRVVAVARDITFRELMQRITNLFDGDFLLKYQILPEDLDALVSVRNNEDLYHMIGEYDRQCCSGAPKLRTFLFPSKPVMVESHAGYFTPHALHQHYIDAINGILHLSTSKCSSINTTRPTFSISACSSPKSLSPDSPTGTEPSFSSRHRRSNMTSMHKVWSSPTLFNLGGGGGQQAHSQQQQQQPQGYYQNQYSQQCNMYGRQGHRPPPQLYRSGERLHSWQYDMERHHTGHGLGPYRPQPRRHHWGGSGLGGNVHPNECRNYNFLRGDALPPQSPRRE